MRRIIYTIILLIIILLLYGFYFNTKGLNVKEYSIVAESIPETFEELKFIHFSDILYKSTTDKNDIEKIAKKINSLDADVIFFTGDLFSKEHKPSEDDIETLTKTMEKIDAKQYKFAIIGDSDKKYLNEYKQIMDKSNFIILDNENFLLFYKDISPINIIGLSDENKLDDLLTTDIEYQYSIALTHKPDIFSNINNKNVDLVLAGHSLNGQVRIPFIGGVLKREGSINYIDNHYSENNSEMYVSNGIGTIKYKIRLFNKPSINLYRFNKKT